MQIARLFEIVYLLMERGCIPAPELAQRFEVSTRTIYRDVETLSQAGIPVYATRGRDGGIQLLPEFVLGSSLLTEAEQNQILSALQGFQAAGEPEAAAVFERLRSLFRRPGYNWIDVDFSPWGGGGAQDKFQVIKTGIIEGRVLTFQYYSSDGRSSARQVEPARLRFRGRSWYLQAFCRDRQAFRTFRLSRMDQVACTGQRFSPRTPPELDVADTCAGRVVRLKLLFAPQVAYRLFDDYDRGSVQPLPDGGYLVEAWYPEDDWVYGHLLSYGTGVEVLEPAHVRQVLGELAVKIAARYQSANKPDGMMSSLACYTMGNQFKGACHMDGQVFCQSCGMPMSEEGHFGTEADGSKSQEYCTYCYQNGAFTQDVTMEQMVETCAGFMEGDKEQAKKDMLAWFPTLKRWKK